MRTIVDLPEEQLEALAELCRRESISRAEAVRRALADLLIREKSQTRAATFGAWKGKRADARQVVDRLRNEWKP